MNEKLYKMNLINFSASLLLASSLPMFILYQKFLGSLLLGFIGLSLSILMLVACLKTNTSKDYYERVHAYIMLRTAIRQSRILLIAYGICLTMIAALWYSHVSIRLMGSVGESLWFQWKCLFLIPITLSGLVGLSSSLRVFCELKLNSLPHPQNDLKISFILASVFASLFPLAALFLLLFGRSVPKKAVESLYPVSYQQLPLDLP